MKRPLITAAAILCAAFSMTSSFAIMQKMTVRQLTVQSKQILMGRVDSTECFWDNGIIKTRVTVTPKFVVKGSAPGKIVFDVPGGTIGRTRLDVEDMPTFTVGHDVFLYLDENQMPVVGGIQGKFEVENGKVGDTNEPVYDYALGVKDIVRQTSPAIASETLTPSAQPTPMKEVHIRPDSVAVQPVVSAPKVSSVMPAGVTSWQTVVSEGFDAGIPADGLWDCDHDPTWGTTSVKSFSGSNSIWCAAGGDHGVDPATSSYPGNVDSWIVYGPLDLSKTTGAEMTFMLSCQIRENLDWIYWETSTDNRRFGDYGFQMTGGDGTWSQQTLDLTPLCGASQVWIAFEFTSYELVTENLPGVFIDDVVVKELGSEPPPTSSPIITSIDPPKASSGTHEPITITGQNFGPRYATCKVDFFFQKNGDETIRIPADTILSWSDTKIVCELPIGVVTDFAGEQYFGSAASGPVRVTTSMGPSNEYEFDVSFAYGGAKWVNNPPIVTYKVNENDADCMSEGSAVQAAASSWGSCGSLFNFLYSGSHSNTAASLNGTNEIMWGAAPRPDIIAQNQRWSDTFTHEVTETDIVYNSSLPFSSSGAPGAYDIQTIGTHELGHSLTLLDLYGDRDVNKVMYGFAWPGLVKRTLSSDDIAGAKWIYQSGSIGEIKNAGGSATIYAKPVTAAFNGSFYIEEPNRSSGIMVDSTTDVEVNDLVSIKGDISTNSLGEKVLTPTSVDPVEGTLTVKPLGMNLSAAVRDLPEGMLVTCSGIAEYVPNGLTSTYFYLNDGSCIIDASGHHGLKVLLNGVMAPVQGTFVTVTGIRTRALVEKAPAPVLKVRTEEDID